jgi:hypothetical protein
LVFEPGFAALNVSIFNAQDVRPTGLAGYKPVEKSSPGVANMKMAGW